MIFNEYLYGDNTPATVRAIKALNQVGFKFSLCLHHDVQNTPRLTLGCGYIDGIKKIEEFAQRFKSRAG